MNRNPLLRHARRLVTSAAAVAAVLAPAAASAQITAIGNTAEIVALFVRGVDVAFDPTTNGYMLVGAQNTVVARCVNGDGVPTGNAITIKPASGSFGAYPRARFSPHANSGKGAFLVVWPEELGTTVTLHSRMVSCTDGLLGSEQVISGGATSWLESGAAIAYSATSQRFLVVWKSFPPNAAIKARAVDNNGTGIGDVVTLSNGFGRDPGVAWNSTTDEFGVSFSGETATSAFSAFVKVPATNPANFARTTFNVIGGGLTTISDIDYNPHTNRYVMTWFEFPGPNTRVAEFDAAGNLVEQRLATSTIGSYDALSIAYNTVAKMFAVVGVDRVNDDVYALELTPAGVRSGSELRISTSARPARYTRVAASDAAPAWNSTFNVRNFLAIANQPFKTASVGSPAGGGGGGNPPAGAPAPRMSIDSPAQNGRVASTGFAIAGWALDAGSTAGTGVDTVHIWAYPTSGGTATFLGVASYGVSRPDVGAAFGHARFGTSGFGLNASLPPGQYDVAVFPHSTVAGAFTAAQVVRVTVEAPASVPRMWVDTPTQGSNLSQNVTVSGWAIDVAPGSDTGVDAVHVWAYPTSGNPILVGVAAYGSSRPDVGNAFGGSRFANSGFTVTGTLPPGDYTIVAFAHSSVVKAFNNVFVINVRVN